MKPSTSYTFTAVAAPGSYQSAEDETLDTGTGTGTIVSAHQQATGPPATRRELWSYYAYYAGNNGIGSFQYAPCSDDSPCHVFWNGGTKEPVYSFSIGSLADFGNWNPWVVRTFSLLSFAFEFGFLGVQYAYQWKIAMALYILSSVTWWASYVFFNAIFPKLAHDLPEVHKAREDFAQGG
ncbi:hypothetical protein DID88_007476 [Monilinia fructigena]|uniref:Autophagy-related protein n=1 Tax=Monilinia fructigena TaxID=38457 RepID=A0A395J8D0_9HELO|nr:hypothetical protein DID88_007476 [Monilinia fructigena]